MIKHCSNCGWWYNNTEIIIKMREEGKTAGEINFEVAEGGCKNPNHCKSLYKSWVTKEEADEIKLQQKIEDKDW